jgi:dihydrofolate reductase
VARLIYSAITSLDGYVADAEGNFDWAEPDLEVHAFVNDRERPLGTYLYGRRMYEVMQAWETLGADPDATDVTRDFANLWLAADKVVYSTTLDATPTSRTRLERSFDADAVRAMKERADADLGIGGPGIAVHALRAGLVDEINLYLNPIVVGAGTSALPTGFATRLRLVDEHRFGNGVVYVQYRVER